MFFLFVFLCFFFLSPIPPYPAYLDDEEDEDPFGDYVISKSHLNVASVREPSFLAYLLVCDCVSCVFVPFL